MRATYVMYVSTQMSENFCVACMYVGCAGLFTRLSSFARGPSVPAYPVSVSGWLSGLVRPCCNSSTVHHTEGGTSRRNDLLVRWVRKIQNQPKDTRSRQNRTGRAQTQLPKNEYGAYVPNTRSRSPNPMGRQAKRQWHTRTTDK